MLSKFSAVFLVLFFVLTAVSLALAMEVSFQWGQSSGQVDGYRIYCADMQGGPYLDKIYEGNETTLNHTLSLPEDQEYYLVCRAFNVYGESGDSNEVHWFYAVPGSPGQLQWTINLSQLLDSLGANKIQFVSR